MGSCVSVHKEPESATKLQTSLGSKHEEIETPQTPAKEEEEIIDGEEKKERIDGEEKKERIDVEEKKERIDGEEKKERNDGEEKKDTIDGEEKKERIDGEDRTVSDVALKSEWSPTPPVTSFRDYGGSKDETFFESQPWLDSDCDDDFISVNGEFTPSRGSTPVHHSFSLGTPRVNVPEEIISSEPSHSDNQKRLSELFKDSLRIEQSPDDPNEAQEENMAPEKVESEPKSAQCCLPRLLSTRSLNERKKKITIPSPAREPTPTLVVV